MKLVWVYCLDRTDDRKPFLVSETGHDNPVKFGAVLIKNYVETDFSADRNLKGLESEVGKFEDGFL